MNTWKIKTEEKSAKKLWKKRPLVAQPLFVWWGGGEGQRHCHPPPHPMGEALTASLTGPEMAVSPPGASWERGKHSGYWGHAGELLKVKRPKWWWRWRRLRSCAPLKKEKCFPDTLINAQLNESIMVRAPVVGKYSGLFVLNSLWPGPFSKSGQSCRFLPPPPLMLTHTHL